MNEILRLLNASGVGPYLLIAVGIIWLLVEVRSLKARAKEDRETAERRFREISEATERRAKEDREMAEQQFRKYSEETERRAKEYSAQNEAEHGRLSTSVDEVNTKVDELKTSVEDLLDRSNRPDSGSGTA